MRVISINNPNHIKLEDSIVKIPKVVIKKIISPTNAQYSSHPLSAKFFCDCLNYCLGLHDLPTFTLHTLHSCDTQFKKNRRKCTFGPYILGHFLIWFLN